MSNKQRIIISIGAVLFVGVIIAAIIYSLIPKAYITFATAPGTVNVQIDNHPIQTVQNTQTITVTPGTHTIKVSQSEFGPYDKEVTLKNGQKTEFLVALNPLTDAAKSLLQDQASQDIIQRFYGKALSDQTDALVKKYPILNTLPIQARLYTISACPSQKYPNDQTRIALCVDLYHSDLQPYVLKDISSRGYNPNDYEIIWNDKYDSPTTTQ